METVTVRDLNRDPRRWSRLAYDNCAVRILSSKGFAETRLGSMTGNGSGAQVAFGPTSPRSDVNTSGVELASDGSFAHFKLLRHRRERVTVRVVSGSLGNIG